MRAFALGLFLLATSPAWSAQMYFQPIEVNGETPAGAFVPGDPLELTPGDIALIELVITGVPGGITAVQADVMFNPLAMRVSNPNVPKGLDIFQDFILGNAAAFRPLDSLGNTEACNFGKRCNDSRFVFGNLRADEMISPANGLVNDASGNPIPGLLRFAHSVLGVNKSGSDGALAVLEVELLPPPLTVTSTPMLLELDEVIVLDSNRSVLEVETFALAVVVPLPASAWALLSACAVVALSRRRRTRASV